MRDVPRAGFRLDARQRGYAFQAFGYLTAARLRFATLSTKEILADLAKGGAPDQTTRARDELDLKAIGWAIPAVSRRLPWRSDCLIQAMAATTWMRAHGLDPDFHVGVKKECDGTILAHAWVRFGDRTVVGGAPVDLESFAPILDSRDVARVARVFG